MKSVFGALNGLHTQTPETIADNGGHQSVGAIHDHVAHDWALLTIDLSGAVSVDALSRLDTPFRAAVTAQLATGKQTRQREVVLRNADAETAAVADQPTVGGDFAFLAEVGFSAVWLGDVGLSRIGFPNTLGYLQKYRHSCAYSPCVKFCDKRLSYLGITGIEFSLIKSIECVMPKLSNICPHMLFPLKSNS